MKKKVGPRRLIVPFPTVLVATGNMVEANIVTIAWISMLTGNPPTLGISIGSKGHSAQKIIDNGDFSVNLATVEIMREADFCGITTGKDTDKFKSTGLTKMEAALIHSPIIAECPINVECKVKEHNMFGRTFHIAGEILETHINDSAGMEGDDTETIDPSSLDPLIYFSGVRQYFRIGSESGKAYSVGRSIKRSDR